MSAGALIGDIDLARGWALFAGRRLRPRARRQEARMSLPITATSGRSAYAVTFVFATSRAPIQSPASGRRIVEHRTRGGVADVDSRGHSARQRSRIFRHAGVREGAIGRTRLARVGRPLRCAVTGVDAGIVSQATAADRGDRHYRPSDLLYSLNGILAHELRTSSRHENQKGEGKKTASLFELILRLT